MKKKITLILAILVVGIIIYYNAAPYFRNVETDKVWLQLDTCDEEKLLLDFINNKLMDEEGGVYTNYINSDSQGDITKGHAVLSESQGIMLLYSLEKNDRITFDRTLDYIRNYMVLKNNLISWRIEDKSKSEISATIDDLRIIKALLLAEEKWNDKSYRGIALRISKGISKELIENDILADFNDGISKSKTTTLCYLDLQTIKMLSNLNSSWEKVLKTSLQILNNGYVSDEVPLYKKEFYRASETYDDENIDTLLSMIVLLNKQEYGEDIGKSIAWIKQKFINDGFISTLYSTSGESLTNIESTSIYSFIIQMASKADDKELARLAMNKVKAFQVNNKESIIYGGYGMEDGLQVYSYDNLNALFAHRYFKYQ
ncbi:glycosyl hydrolase family 8 [Clostridium botulinum]|uniref:glycosyl hydrolase family 8 n=1 Tax=Clostridium TaxID=1485 RepID=UPI000CF64759|nr:MULTISPECIES: glycosyl hydrolase family 8 [Clostridium]NFN93527.1 glycosyl hydrolase family 8 [Clostridium botulinum]NFR86577.1 glycosyl hydrolase family 8 [Clostridium botulinum]NFR91012.1 glycosyl hydrolase family 8 [Clostridium botulinum]NFS95289.1 glycosyl hydrolase family 8 [Clostridium botulinum]NFT99518.1 glycosyl hydrolase family 8 [Clostridium botulinum]